MAGMQINSKALLACSGGSSVITTLKFQIPNCKIKHIECANYMQPVQSMIVGNEIHQRQSNLKASTKCMESSADTL